MRQSERITHDLHNSIGEVHEASPFVPELFSDSRDPMISFPFIFMRLILVIIILSADKAVRLGTKLNVYSDVAALRRSQAPPSFSEKGKILIDFRAEKCRGAREKIEQKTSRWLLERRIDRAKRKTSHKLKLRDSVVDMQTVLCLRSMRSRALELVGNFCVSRTFNRKPIIMLDSCDTRPRHSKGKCAFRSAGRNAHVQLLLNRARIRIFLKNWNFS